MKEKSVNCQHYLVVSLLLIASMSVAVYYVQNTSQNGEGITGYATSQLGNLSVTVATSISCTWTSNALAITFGSSPDAGTNDVNATLNWQEGTNATSYYNVTVDTLSNVQANITMLASNLTSGANIIGVPNMTWASNTTIGNGSNMLPANSIALSHAYNTANPVAASEPIGSTVWFRLWLDIPGGQLAGSYTGNYTQQCAQA